MLSLPVELRLPIIHHIRDSIAWTSFDYDVDASILAIQDFYKVLIALSLLHREWTAIAQSELFRNLYIRDEGKLELLLELLRGDGEFKVYIQQSRRAVLGRNRWWRQEDAETTSTNSQIIAPIWQRCLALAWTFIWSIFVRCPTPILHDFRW